MSKVLPYGLLVCSVAFLIASFTTKSLGPELLSRGTSLTADEKNAIAEEVKAQLAGEQATASPPASLSDSGSETPPALDPAHRTFIVDTDVAVISNGRQCALTSGDVLTRLAETPDVDQRVTARVSASKKSDCPVGTTVSVAVDDLQEMQNHFQETLDKGLGSVSSPAAEEELRWKKVLALRQSKGTKESIAEAEAQVEYWTGEKERAEKKAATLEKAAADEETARKAQQAVDEAEAKEKLAVERRDHFLKAFVPVAVTLTLLVGALFVILSKRYTPADRHWAYATVGTLLGYWLKR
jgi:hypothetical protein